MNLDIERSPWVANLCWLRILIRVNDCFQTELSAALLDHSMLMEFAQKLWSISGCTPEELEKIAAILLKFHRMTPEELKSRSYCTLKMHKSIFSLRDMVAVLMEFV